MSYNFEIWCNTNCSITEQQPLVALVMPINLEKAGLWAIRPFILTLGGQICVLNSILILTDTGASHDKSKFNQVQKNNRDNIIVILNKDNKIGIFIVVLKGHILSLAL